MIANSSPKNSGATSANSTAADAAAVAPEPAQGVPGELARRATASTNALNKRRMCRKQYLKVIVEVFRGVERNNPFR